MSEPEHREPTPKLEQTAVGLVGLVAKCLLQASFTSKARQARMKAANAPLKVWHLLSRYAQLLPLVRHAVASIV